MPKFKKKPIIIEAIQWNPAGKQFCRDHPCVRGTNYMEVHELLGTSGCTNDAIMWDWTRLGCIDTFEGKHLVTPGDWIITGVKGEQYPCKPDIFEATYEPVD